MSDEVDASEEPNASPTTSRRPRRRRPGRRELRSPTQTWAHLIMAGMLLFGLLAFWGQLATGAAACFSALAPPPEAQEEVHVPEPKPSHRQIQIKRVPKAP